mgnify:CR=1 FL=1
MSVSIIIPACDAEATLPRALKSLFRQTETDWQAIIVSDDQRDYAALLQGQGIQDPRLSFASTGLYRSGCHHARNVGFEVIEGSNLTRDGMTERLLEFGRKAQGADVAVQRLNHRPRPHAIAAMQLHGLLADKAHGIADLELGTAHGSATLIGGRIKFEAGVIAHGAA